MDDLSKLPNVTDSKDLRVFAALHKTKLHNVSVSAATVTDKVILMNSLCKNPRQKFVFEALVRHLHDFTREVSLTSEEWMCIVKVHDWGYLLMKICRASIKFLTDVGHITSDIRQEFILLSDIFGWSALVDSLNHPIKAGSNASEATVLGPFFVEDSKKAGAASSAVAIWLSYLCLTLMLRLKTANPLPPKAQANTYS